MQAAKMRASVSPCAPAMAGRAAARDVDAAVGDHLGAKLTTASTIRSAPRA
jgi:hypothetical protein